MAVFGLAWVKRGGRGEPNGVGENRPPRKGIRGPKNRTSEGSRYKVPEVAEISIVLIGYRNEGSRGGDAGQRGACRQLPGRVMASRYYGDLGDIETI